MSADETIFSKIISGAIPADIVYRDDLVTAFRDIQPAAPTHILVVPNRAIPSLVETTSADAPLLGTLLQAAVQIARQEGLEASGYRVVINTGQDGGQSVAHLHLHLLGGRALAWPPG
jgi:histidine triad (HIT) family protein